MRGDDAEHQFAAGRYYLSLTRLEAGLAGLAAHHGGPQRVVPGADALAGVVRPRLFVDVEAFGGLLGAVPKLGSSLTEGTSY